jgi:S-formylglutathione hydrolase FrmB
VPRLRLGRTAVVAGIAALAGLPATASANRVITIKAPSKLVDVNSPGGLLNGGRQTLRANVLLPDGYDAHPNRRYPVLYLLHGATFDYRAWQQTMDVTKTAAHFPGVIVMPDGGRFGMYTDWFNNGARGQPKWLSYFTQELPGIVERRFRIRHARRWHAVAGLSMGGQGALRLAAAMPGYFGSVAGFSPAVPDIQSPETPLGILAIGQGTTTYESIWGPLTGYYAAGNNTAAQLENLQYTRMYLTSGNGVNCPDDPVNPQSIAVDITVEAAIYRQLTVFGPAAQSAGIDTTTKATCGVHTFGVWKRALADAINNWHFFKAVPRSPSSWTYKTVARHGRMWHFRFSFADFPGQVITFHRDGSTIGADGTGTVMLRGAHGCRLRLVLPAQKTLPQACA